MLNGTFSIELPLEDALSVELSNDFSKSPGVLHLKMWVQRFDRELPHLRASKTAAPILVCNKNVKPLLNCSFFIKLPREGFVSMELTTKFSQKS